MPMKIEMDPCKYIGPHKQRVVTIQGSEYKLQYRITCRYLKSYRLLI